MEFQMQTLHVKKELRKVTASLSVRDRQGDQFFCLSS